MKCRCRDFPPTRKRKEKQSFALQDVDEAMECSEKPGAGGNIYGMHFIAQLSPYLN